MAKSIFITATGTDIGKTYTSALIVKNIKDEGFNIGYYKALLSGSDDIKDSDAWYVKEKANLNDNYYDIVSYTYKNPYSPHLAAKIENNPPNLEIIKRDFNNISKKYDYMIVEGCGGIICPIRYEDNNKIFLEDIIINLELPSIIVADSGLGTINSTILTIKYMQSKNLKINGIILNKFDSSNIMHKDNLNMIEKISDIDVIAVIENGEFKKNKLNNLIDIFK